MNKQDDSIVNHKIDSVNKLMSIINACKAIHFQNELIAKWHKNKKMKFGNLNNFNMIFFVSIFSGDFSAMSINCSNLDFIFKYILINF